MIALSSCSVWDIIKPSSGLSVDTEIVAGDKAINTEVSGKKETNNNTADTINQVFNTVNEEHNWFPWLMAVLGFMLPTPSRMWIGIKELVRRKK